MVETVTVSMHRVALIIVAVIIVALAAIPFVANGHVLDEYLQSTLVVIEPGDIRLKINMTPGIEIAERVLSQIDHNQDGAISSDESAAYAAMLKRDLTVHLDGRDTQLKLVSSTIPDPTELRTGQGIIQMEFAVTPCSFSNGNHLLTFENRHFESIGVNLFNAARPRSASIRIARQNRNVNQSKAEIEFVYSARSSLFLGTPGILASAAVILFGIWIALGRMPLRLKAISP